MCGIAGIFNFGATPTDDEQVLCRMRDAMVHRGPDDAGFYRNPDRRVALGHRRLSIVDLSSCGHQPMANEDDSVWITFNGEIYNHADLRGPLSDKGHRFRSRSDTEAIIHMYEERGAECVSQLDGMFAFGIWDEARRRLMLARDRLGKKALYYTVRGGRLLFASEIKGLLVHPDVPRDIDMEALNLYLTFSNVPAPLTLFAGIRKLPPGHVLLCDGRGDLSISRFWSPLDGDPWPRRTTEAEAVEQVRHLLKRSVKKRLMSDVPFGAFLSGGVDSSANVALMSQLTSEPLRTFSLGFTGFGEAENFHDLPYARRVARHFSCQHHEVMVTAKECKDYLPELARQQDEPIGDPACLPMHFVSRAAKKDGVTVVLVGEGSDEVFGGYDDMAQVVRSASRRWRRLMRLPRLLRRGLHKASQLMDAPAGRTDVLRRAAAGEPLYWGLDVVFWDTEKEHLFPPWVRPRLGPSASRTVQQIYDEIGRRQPRADQLQKMSIVELSNRLPELLLMRVDKLSMAHSLEARAPFLDAELMSYGVSLPQRLKITSNRTKAVLKEAVRPFLPQEVIDRPKQGFRVPLPAWLGGELSAWAEKELFSSSLCKRGIFNMEYVDSLWRRHRANVQDHSFDLWCLINLAAWHDQWIIKGPGKGPGDRDDGMRDMSGERGGQPATVLYVVDGLGLSGKTKALVDLACRLDGDRYRAAVCCFDEEQGPLSARLRQKGIPIFVVPCKDGLQFGMVPRLYRVIKNVGPQVVHCYNPRTMLYAGLAARLLGIHATVGSLSAFACQVPDRSYAFLPQQLFTNSARNRWRNQVVARLMRNLVTVSRVLGERFSTFNGVPAEKMRVITYGVDVSAPRHYTPEEIAQKRAELGVAPDEVLIGSVGRLIEQKDYPTQFRAFAHALSATRATEGPPKLRMVVAGDGPLRGELTALAARLGIADRTLFIGHTDGVPLLLRSLDIFVLSSKFEPFGVALLEAKAAGVAIAATAVNEIPHVIIQDGESGLLAPKESPEELGRIFVRLAGDPALRQRLGQQAFLESRDQNSLEAMVNRYQGLYDETRGLATEPALDTTTGSSTQSALG